MRISKIIVTFIEEVMVLESQVVGEEEVPRR